MCFPSLTTLHPDFTSSVNLGIRFAIGVYVHRLNKFWRSHVVVLQKTAEKCTQFENARAELYFCPLEISFFSMFSQPSPSWFHAQGPYYDNQSLTKFLEKCFWLFGIQRNSMKQVTALSNCGRFIDGACGWLLTTWIPSSYHLFSLSVHLLIVFLAPYGMCHRACRGRIGNICFMLQTPNIHDLKHVCFSTQ